jgi:hypothetical protein
VLVEVAVASNGTSSPPHEAATVTTTKIAAYE